MSEAKRKHHDQVSADLALDGFEKFFDSTNGSDLNEQAEGNGLDKGQIGLLVNRFSELLTLMADQRIETARIANQLIENQRQLIATQQILIRLMEKSIELTRHITGIEEKLPGVFELPRLFESLRLQVAHLEGIEQN